MAAPQRLVWEDKAADLAKAMLLLVNSKNEAAKKDLRLAYAQGNLTAYPGGCEKMARFLLSQYANKKTNNPINNNRGKKGDKNKKDDNAKSEDKGDDNAGTAGAHVGEAASDKDEKGAPSDSSSIGAHVSDVTKTILPQTQRVQDILAAHPIDNPIWDHTDPGDILIDTVNSAEDLAGAHVANQEHQDYHDQQNQ